MRGLSLGLVISVILLVTSGISRVVDGYQGQEEEINPLLMRILAAEYLNGFAMSPDAIEKRVRNKGFAFGLGKRDRVFSFGIGKRSGEAASPDGGYLMVDDTEREPTEDTNVAELMISPDAAEFMDKRKDKGYAFGIGKRPSNFRFGIGKRLSNDDYEHGLDSEDIDDSSNVPWLKRGRQSYAYGLGKRSFRNGYEFGLGKRSYDESNMDSNTEKRSRNGYAFGIGKRAKGTYAFGVGKRANDYESSVESSKRAKAGYAFGIGKRSAKRYKFGIGKRANVGTQGETDADLHELVEEKDNELAL